MKFLIMGISPAYCYLFLKSKCSQHPVLKHPQSVLGLRFSVLTMNNTVYWDMMLCSSIVHLRFGEIYCFHLQGCCLFFASCLLGSLFVLEEKGSTLANYRTSPRHNPEENALHIPPKFFLECAKPSFTPTKNYRQNYGSPCSNPTRKVSDIINLSRSTGI
jgi:hypothetical protein